MNLKEMKYRKHILKLIQENLLLQNKIIQQENQINIYKNLLFTEFKEKKGTTNE